MSDFFFVAFSCGGRTRHRLLANALTLVKELRPGACRALQQQKKSDKNRTSLLRRQDSNMRPPGYEPGELPTAPLRDIQTSFRVLRCKGTAFSRDIQIFFKKLFVFGGNMVICDNNSLKNTASNRASK